MPLSTIRALIAADIRRGLAYTYGSYSSYEAFMVAIGRLSLRRTRRLRNAATDRLNDERAHYPHWTSDLADYQRHVRAARAS